MQTRSAAIGFIVLLATCVQACSSMAASSDVPGNLALKAKVSVSSAHSDRYRAENLVDGQIPAPLGRDDVGKAWCAKGNQHPDGVTVTFQWSEPVRVAAIVYYGRTAWLWTENFKNYELYLDDAATPVVKGVLQPGQGPQRIKLPEARTARKLNLKFLDCYGDYCPGAAEVQIFTEPVPENVLPPFVRK